MLRLSVLIPTFLLLVSCQLSPSGYQNLRKAEEFTRQERYDQAIESYRRHIEVRLEKEDRPEWENPYFYYLIIGDLELGQGHIAKALAAYELAQRKGVAKSLVSDRYRLVASWHESHGELNKAASIAEHYRELDPLLFDLMLDRLSKQIVLEENRSIPAP